MATMVCPTCGSLGLVGTACAKCGVKLLSSEQASAQKNTVSFVAPAAAGAVVEQQQAQHPPLPSGYENMLAYNRMRERSKRKTRFVTWLVILVLAFVAFEVSDFFLNRASVYSGYYWNQHYFFALTFPDSGWSHARERQLKTLPFKDAIDAFYSGGTIRSPKVLMTVWADDSTNSYVAPFSETLSENLLNEAVEKIQNRVTQSGMSFEFIDSDKIAIGAGEGFLIHANLTKEKTPLQAILYCAYDQHTAYMILFTGEENEMEARQAVIKPMMKTFVFRHTLI